MNKNAYDYRVVGLLHFRYALFSVFAYQDEIRLLCLVDSPHYMRKTKYRFVIRLSVMQKRLRKICDCLHWEQL